MAELASLRQAAEQARGQVAELQEENRQYKKQIKVGTTALPRALACALYVTKRAQGLLLMHCMSAQQHAQTKGSSF